MMSKQLVPLMVQSGTRCTSCQATGLTIYQLMEEGRDVRACPRAPTLVPSKQAQTPCCYSAKSRLEKSKTSNNLHLTVAIYTSIYLVVNNKQTFNEESTVKKSFITDLRLVHDFTIKYLVILFFLKVPSISQSETFTQTIHINKNTQLLS